jgi:hypothetical protein
MTALAHSEDAERPFPGDGKRLRRIPSPDFSAGAPLRRDRIARVRRSRDEAALLQAFHHSRFFVAQAANTVAKNKKRPLLPAALSLNHEDSRR